jgi:Reverse transcriptase (RNA-dependent DNA polymerase)
MRIHEDDIAKAAITTPFGHWEHLVLPMGMANSPSAFMALMNDVVRGMEQYVTICIDERLIHSKTPEEHAIHLKAVLSRLSKHQLYAKRFKCKFAQSTLKFLGHIIGADGIKEDPEIINVLQEWPVPANVTGVRQFVGLANYF